MPSSGSEGPRPLRHVHVIGAGLIGASIGMALSRAGIRVTLEDASPIGQALARDLGAGSLDEPGEDVDVVVVATPPDVAADVCVAALERFPRAAVTDVASVKEIIEAEVLQQAVEGTSRFVGSHPMAGRERSGAIAARADLFDARAWVVVPHENSTPEAFEAVVQLATTCGAVTRTMGAREHDIAVAHVSHVPQVAASLVAAQLLDLPEEAVSLSGQGIRDVTRIAASDPRLWTQILSGNGSQIRATLVRMREQLDGVIDALDGQDGYLPEGSLAVLGRLIEAGNLGQARIPGKHGSAPTAYAVVGVLVPDEPGRLAALMADIGDAGINLEDLHIEHGMGQPVGLAEVSVVPASAEPLRTMLTEKGWRVAD